MWVSKRSVRTEDVDALLDGIGDHVSLQDAKGSPFREDGDVTAST